MYQLLKSGKQSPGSDFAGCPNNAVKENPNHRVQVDGASFWLPFCFEQCFSLLCHDLRRSWKPNWDPEWTKKGQTHRHMETQTERSVSGGPVLRGRCTSRSWELSVFLFCAPHLLIHLKPASNTNWHTWIQVGSASHPPRKWSLSFQGDILWNCINTHLGIKSLVWEWSVAKSDLFPLEWVS